MPAHVISSQSQSATFVAILSLVIGVQTALVAVQLTTSTRAAYGIAGAVIGVAYVLRAVGDVSAHALSWVSPIGWYQATRAFSGLRW